MKILSSEQIRQADAITIKNEPIRSIDLMERAAVACVKWLSDLPVLRVSGSLIPGSKATVKGRRGEPEKGIIKIFCGLGNNGGDGLVIARLLAAKKFKVEVYIIRYANKCSDDFLINEKRLKKVKGVKIHTITSATQLSPKGLLRSNFPRQNDSVGLATFPEGAPSEKLATLCIDCLFGSGLNKPVDGLAADAIACMNRSGVPVISIDIPSGLFAEENSHTEKTPIVRAAHTLTFQAPKLAFMFPENGKYIGEFTVLDIGLDKNFIALAASQDYFVSFAQVRSILKSRSRFSHKGTFGHALIVSGSYGKIGACVLASRACLSAGAGLVTAYIPKCGYDILQTSNPEVMVEVDSSEKFISDTIPFEKYNAIGVGPGIGTEKETQSALKVLIQNASAPLVLDADALNILSENKTWVAFLPKNTILTPHPGEFKRLAGNWDNDLERLQLQKKFSLKNRVYVVLKGAYTCITCPDGETYFNSTGNPGMATAGSGDVLTGIITGLLAQGYDPKQACILGVYLHGSAGDIAAHHASEESLIARNIIEFLGEAFKVL